jgi:RNA methyltransferase, TrmH family
MSNEGSHRPLEPSPGGLDRHSTARRRHTVPFPQPSSTITHYQHPSIQRIHRLRYRDDREDSGHYYVEGLRFVFQAVQQHASLEAIVVCPRLLTHNRAQRLVRHQRHLGVPILQVTPRVMHQLTLVNDPQGIGAVVRQHWEALAHISPGDGLCWIALHMVRSAGNLGTILRTSDAVGGAGVILLGNAVDPYDPATVRATMGSLYSQRLVRTTPAAFARWKRRHGCVLVGTAPDAPIDYHALSYRRLAVLFMGEERRGLPTDLQALCDHMVRIPMVGRSDSLNLGVATALMLYELFNQRRASSGAPPEPVL